MRRWKMEEHFYRSVGDMAQGKEVWDLKIIETDLQVTNLYFSTFILQSYQERVCCN